MKLIGTLVILFCAASAQAATLEVCDHCAITSLRRAVEIARPLDTIRVSRGIAPEGMITIDKPLHLTGVDYPVIDGLGKEQVFYVRADDVTIEGFEIRGSGNSDISDYAGIRVEESHRCHILNNRFRNNTYAVYLAHVSECEVAGNDIKGQAVSEVRSGNGIHMWYSDKITLRHNNITGHRDGLYFEFTGNSLIEGNRCEHNIRYGLHFMFSSNNRYVNNVFSDNQTGVAVMYSKHVVMEGNRFEKSWGAVSYGLLLKDISDSSLTGNIFDGNTVGVLSDGGARDQFEDNTFLHNGWAVNILGNSEGNTFRKNNFFGNYFDVSTDSRDSHNDFTANYWSDYHGYDIDRNGVGDVSFRPMKMFSIWVNRYPELVALFDSPVVEFLEIAEKVFPVLTPPTLEDPAPAMRPL